MTEVAEFLTDAKKTPQVATLIAMSIKLIMSEFVINPNNYNKYPVQRYSDEDFVDMVIRAMALKIPSIEDIKGNEKYIDEIREVIWGHIKIHLERLPQILLLMIDPKMLEVGLKEDDADIFLECLTVAWVECVLRKRESLILEKTYED